MISTTTEIPFVIIIASVKEENFKDDYSKQKLMI